MARIGVAISGGGHRASLFGLGALLYLADAGQNVDVVSIASVSGGSLTNGFVAQQVDFAKVDPEGFRARVVRPLAGCIAQKGTVLPPSPFTLLYLIALGMVTLAAVVGVWFIPWPVGLRVAAFVVGLLVAGLVAQQRGNITLRAFRRLLFAPEGRSTSLSDIHTNIDHVLCSTDLHAGENVYFSGRFVCSYRFGWGEPGDLPLVYPVQASAALPGAFPPRRLPTVRHRFAHALPEVQGTSTLVLVDGGVYDNMADQWGLNIADRKARWPEAAGLQEVDQLVVVNSSAGMAWQPKLGRLGFPLLGEFLALLHDKSILYDNGNSVRREWLRDRFAAATSGGPGPNGVLVHIPQTPMTEASAFASSTDPQLSGRANAVLALLEPRKDYWTTLARSCATEKTSLSKFGTRRAANLLEHGYVLAMCNLHVLLGSPLLPLPDRPDLEQICS
jgi:predicted acylesterase/phospholipase RssA